MNPPELGDGRVNRQGFSSGDQSLYPLCDKESTVMLDMLHKYIIVRTWHTALSLPVMICLTYVTRLNVVILTQSMIFFQTKASGSIAQPNCFHLMLKHSKKP